MAAVLEFAGVTVRKGRATLLDDIDWTVEEDERWVVLGPNGAGKTTLLQVASAQLHPTTGVAGILDEVLGTVDVFELRPRIGLTSAALAERIPRGESVRDLVVSASYGVVGRWREEYDDLDHERALQLLEELGVKGLADRTFGTLSEGERKRVQIARALMTDPELLLLDEPAAGLDLGGREDLVSTLSVLANDPDSPATVLVSHHVEEIPPGFTHALLLRGGKVVAAGPVDAGPDRGAPVRRVRDAAGPPARRRTLERAAAPTPRPGFGHPLGSEAMDWISEHLAALFLGLAILLGVAELASMDLILLMLAVGALVGMLSALLGAGVAVAVIAAAAASVASLAFLRPSLVKRLHGGPELSLGHGKLVGQQALVTEKITGLEAGRIKLSGEVWSAKPYDDTILIEPGSTVEVLEIRGATAYVHPVPSIES